MVAVVVLVSSGASAPRPAPARVGAPATTPASHPAASPATTAATATSPAPDGPAKAPATTAPATTAPDTAAPPAPPGPSGSAAVGTYVRDYCNLVDAHSLSQSCTWLSPAYQHRLGYSYYQQFWNSVRRVDILGITPVSDQATVSIRYDMTDATTQTERALPSFVTAGGRRLIDDTQVTG